MTLQSDCVRLMITGNVSINLRKLRTPSLNELAKKVIGSFPLYNRNFFTFFFTFSTSSLKPPPDGASYYARRFPRPRPL